MPRPKQDNLLIWLPSPMGDAILATPMLRAVRDRFPEARITFYANPVCRAALAPGPFNDAWLGQVSGLKGLSRIRHGRFTRVVLLKNSLGSALACALAGIPDRIGYARDGRGWLLTEGLRPKRRPDGSFAPGSMVDYYLAIAEHLGCEVRDRLPWLAVAPEDREGLGRVLPDLDQGQGPLVVLVPGGAFGPSKCWPAESYARTAERLIRSAKARVVVSVSPNEAERRIAAKIVDLCPAPVINLADHPLNLGQLKALIARSDLMICNDTGPRHIAIALRRKVITLFGPNDPAWTATGWGGEVQIQAEGPCVCCQKPVCRYPDQFCMAQIPVDRVCQTAHDMLS